MNSILTKSFSAQKFKILEPFVYAVLLAVIFSLFFVSSASAHDRIEIGPYSIVFGWVNEPVIVGERNAILLIVSQDEEPFLGVESTMDVEIHYGGRVFLGNLSPTETPGLYTVEIFPTVRGQYEVYLSGTIGDESVDGIILEPEEVKGANLLQFPELVPEVLELEDRIDELESSLNTARTFAFVGIGLGSLGIVLSAIMLFRKRN